MNKQKEYLNIDGWVSDTPVDFSSLKGLHLEKIEVLKDKNNIDVIMFYTKDKTFCMYHQQDCCEQVHIEDICGNIKFLNNTEIYDAYCSSNKGKKEDNTFTWTFYTIHTPKGSLTIRWYGESNGYYSEIVSLIEGIVNPHEFKINKKWD